LSFDPSQAEPGSAPRKKTIIVAKRFGRLANRLSAFANLIALAEERGYRIINPTLHSYAADFPNLAENFYCTYPPPARRSVFDRVPLAGKAIGSFRGLHHLTGVVFALVRRVRIPGVAVVTQQRPFGVSELPPAFNDASIVFTSAWRFRAPDLVMRHAGAIRAFLRPTDAILRRAAGAVDKLRAEADVVVGVHIRGGDYAGFKGGRYLFSATRYADWMRELAEALRPSRVAFLLCSDSPIDKTAFPGLTLGLGPGDAMGDLHAFANCDYLIGPLSTYTQWASFYGNVPLYLLRGAGDRPALDRFTVSDLSEIP
jgi:hypothetical protein